MKAWVCMKWKKTNHSTDESIAGSKKTHRQKSSKNQQKKVWKMLTIPGRSTKQQYGGERTSL